MSISDIDISNPYQECIFIYGMRGSGKTKLLEYLLRQYDLRGIRFLLFDTMHNHKWETKHGKIIRPPFGLKNKLFEHACIHTWKQGNMVFAIEEIDQYCNPRYIPPFLDSLIQLGRNRNISIIATSRRVAEVHSTIVANCDHHFIFKAFLPRDLEYYQKYVGKLVWQALKLPPYHFIYYKVGSSPIICRPVKIYE